MSHHIVEIKDLHYTYPDGNSALRGVSFRITHGETVAIVGANGACLLYTSDAADE